MTDNKYPELPDFDTVEQHVYGACRRYITQDILEPIYNLMRDYVDADRAMRAQAAPEYSEAMGVAGQAYFESVGKHAHPLPAMWRWSEVYEAMIAAAPSAPAQDALRDELRNLQSVTEHSDQSVLLAFSSCRAAQSFRAALAQAKESKT